MSNMSGFVWPHSSTSNSTHNSTILHQMLPREDHDIDRPNQGSKPMTYIGLTVLAILIVLVAAATLESGMDDVKPTKKGWLSSLVGRKHQQTKNPQPVQTLPRYKSDEYRGPGEDSRGAPSPNTYNTFTKAKSRPLPQDHPATRKPSTDIGEVFLGEARPFPTLSVRHLPQPGYFFVGDGEDMGFASDEEAKAPALDLQ
ncbi:hypothetical protein BCR34DRAFT_648236 [Clohesyomyces aquaticus]|uniref:Transmembrane protein n=1 Tax=Clohesyomyces aquaticus TaxID=1231657 RepID=A0A1Y2A8U2_9PLEO|nr:hypothetical protein BCR34DRAFT_648236 [Clohesyomyces aquaticus]